MRLLKCYLANDREGHFVTAGEAMSALGQLWSCASCGCRLVLHAGTLSDPAWFEHDMQTVARDVLMNCTHLDPEVKAEARHRKLRSMLNGLDTTVMTWSWYCVWCGDHYHGVKHCHRCQTGIYSIEEVNWRMNYCCSVRPGHGKACYAPVCCWHHTASAGVVISRGSEPCTFAADGFMRNPPCRFLQGGVEGNQGDGSGGGGGAQGMALKQKFVIRMALSAMPDNHAGSRCEGQMPLSKPAVSGQDQNLPPDILIGGVASLWAASG